MSYILSLSIIEGLNSVKKKFIILYILNVTDIFFTLYLINTGMYQEANLIMAHIIHDELLSIAVKVGIPLILLLVVYNRMKKASERQLILSNRITMVCLIFYGLINISHILWYAIYKIG